MTGAAPVTDDRLGRLATCSLSECCAGAEIALETAGGRSEIDTREGSLSGIGSPRSSSAGRSSKALAGAAILAAALQESAASYITFVSVEGSAGHHEEDDEDHNSDPQSPVRGPQEDPRGPSA